MLGYLVELQNTAQRSYVHSLRPLAFEDVIERKNLRRVRRRIQDGASSCLSTEWADTSYSRDLPKLSLGAPGQDLLLYLIGGSVQVAQIYDQSKHFVHPAQVDQ